MSIHDLSRRIALRIPRIKRFYEYAGDLNRSAFALQEEVLRLRAEVSNLREENTSLLRRITETSVAGQSAQDAMAELAAERDDLELQLYVLRTDHQRAVRLADELRIHLSELHERESSLVNEKQHLEQRLAECEAAKNNLLTSTSSGSKVEQEVAPILGKLITIGADIISVRRSLAANNASDVGVQPARELYFDLLESTLTGCLFEDPSIAPWGERIYDPAVRGIGRDWPAHAQTMIGTARMRNLRVLVESVLADNVPGDFLEAGVWRGGACIYMRGILAAHGVTNRKVWVADSFAGLPPPNPDIYPADAGDLHSTIPELAVSLEEVKRNFSKYDLLDEQVVFVPGWFKDTLPYIPVEELAVLRLDGDMYSSTIETLEALYLKVKPGGYIIIDDYILPACREAVNDFRKKLNIIERLHDVDGAAVYWRKET